MFDASRYFDNASTTPLDPRVLAEMLPFLQDGFGNAHSIHSLGRRSMAAVELARERVAELLGAEDPSQITFTSGATEANNWVIAAHPSGWISPFEHASVREPAMRLGYRTLCNRKEQIEPAPLGKGLVSVMSVNNETGTVFEPAQIRGSAQYLHSDLTQHLGKIAVDLNGIDFASMSAHKLYGPKGAGALYAKDATPQAFLAGGDQEWGRRAGTLNVAAIVGFGAAAALAAENLNENFTRAALMKAQLLAELNDLTDWQLNGGPNASPYIMSVSFAGTEGETLVIEADRAGYAISAGAACSSRSQEPSYVLRALQIPDPLLRGTVRISTGQCNMCESIAGLAKTLKRSVEMLRTMT